jgi:3-oxoacyl-(acyl-carrier-protein) synthase
MKYITDQIAVIGVACRLPGARNYREYWDNLVYGVNSIREIPPERWDLGRYYSPNASDPNKSVSKWCGLLDHVDQFDNQFFNMSPNEAKLMDPQQRILLEETWHCIEDSGLSLYMLQKHITSVFIGFMTNDYRQLVTDPAVKTSSYACLGNFAAILANRISYAFGLRGQSVALDAACAASLVALHQAKQSLLTGESDYAIAGGVNLNLHPWKYISFSKARMLSPDGQCKTFDKDANGYVPGDGVGVLLLQRLGDALRDGNQIYGLLRGSAVNHNGTPPSITAPRVEAQRDVIVAAYRNANVSPETISYVEAHGTGTSLGDPIEIEGLTKAFEAYTSQRQFCKIGSVKTNIGHLEAAAGVAAVIKVLMMMRHRQIPQTLNITVVNPMIHFHETPFEVALAPTTWEPADDRAPLRAGVSAFGFGGVNAHVVLEAFEPSPVTNAAGPTRHDEQILESDSLFILSANSTTSLEAMKHRWDRFVETEGFTRAHLHDLCATLMTRRATFPYRYGGYVTSKDELHAFLHRELPALKKQKPERWCLRIGRGTSGSYAQILPLIMENPLFQRQLNRVHTAFAQLTSVHPLKACVDDECFRPADRFMVEYAYLSTILDLGFRPALITYEGSGVWPALALSGMLTLEDALAVLTDRKTIAEVTLSRPRIPVHDPVTARTFLRYHFDETYLHLLMMELMSEESLLAHILLGGHRLDEQAQIKYQHTQLGALLSRNQTITPELLHQALQEQEETGKLLGAILIERGSCTREQLDDVLHQQAMLRQYIDEVIFPHIDKARVLSVGQYTFKKFLGEWEEPLEAVGEDLQQILHDNAILASDGDLAKRKKLLLLVIIITSLYKLDRKWNLRGDSLLGTHRFHELLELVVDDVMPRDLMAHLLLDDAPDYAHIASVLNARQHLMNPATGYGYISAHRRDLWEVAHIVDWFELAKQATGALPSDQTLRYVDFGEVTPAVANEACTVIRTSVQGDVVKMFKETLLQLWLNGVDLLWGKLYPEGTFNKVALPGYAFDRKSYWL